MNDADLNVSGGGGGGSGSPYSTRTRADENLELHYAVKLIASASSRKHHTQQSRAKQSRAAEGTERILRLRQLLLLLLCLQRRRGIESRRTTKRRDRRNYSSFFLQSRDFTICSCSIYRVRSAYWLLLRVRYALKRISVTRINNCALPRAYQAVTFSNIRISQSNDGFPTFTRRDDLHKISYNDWSNTDERMRASRRNNEIERSTSLDDVRQGARARDPVVTRSRSRTFQPNVETRSVEPPPPYTSITTDTPVDRTQSQIESQNLRIAHDEQRANMTDRRLDEIARLLRDLTVTVRDRTQPQSAFSLVAPQANANPQPAAAAPARPVSLTTR
ncbi:unnamed protein product [Trichogramma brassicae]|uniref:Uncharacterized protein n=1 Tax=Trichogramma brassicae TaxID=86971 RepID=A0A6H5IGE1_9HYME|nr:unnamed protein product [Trichogramma brassicae]